MAIDDIIKEPLGLIKVSQVVLLVISIGCVFGPANGWWYYVGATLIAAFLNTIIMLICYFWKQSFEKSFLELSYTSYFVVAIFISAILLFTQPQYAQAPWKPTEPTEPTETPAPTGTITTLTPPTTAATTPTPSKTTTTPSTSSPTPTSVTISPPTTSVTPSLPTTSDNTSPTTTSVTPSPPTTSVTPSPPITSDNTSPTTSGDTEPPTDSLEEHELNSMDKKSTTQSTTLTQSTKSTIPPGPKNYSKEGPWIAGGVFCIFLVLTYSAEIYFITRRLVT